MFDRARPGGRAATSIRAGRREAVPKTHGRLDPRGRRDSTARDERRAPRRRNPDGVRVQRVLGVVAEWAAGIPRAAQPTGLALGGGAHRGDGAHRPAMAAGPGADDRRWRGVVRGSAHRVPRCRRRDRRERAPRVRWIAPTDLPRGPARRDGGGDPHCGAVSHATGPSDRSGAPRPHGDRHPLPADEGFNAVVAALALGWGIAAALHLAFGSPAGRPTVRQVAGALDELGVVATDVRLASAQAHGYTVMLADAATGSLHVHVYGRDAADAQLVSKVWRFLVYKDSGPTLTLARGCSRSSTRRFA